MMYCVTWDTDFRKPFFIFKCHMILWTHVNDIIYVHTKFTAYSEPIFMNSQIFNSIIYRSLILIFTKIIQQLWEV